MMALVSKGPSDSEFTAEDRERSLRLAVVGEYALGIAHDFSNMLTVVMANASVMALDYETPEETPDELRDIISSAERGNEMIQRLVRYVREEPLDVPLIRFDAAVESLPRQLRALLPKNIELDVQFSDAKFLIRAEVSQLEEIVLNLATNARDAMPDGGTIQLKVSVSEQVFGAASTGGMNVPAGAFVTIAITDSGCGLDQSTRDRMFEPFFSTKKSGKGLGLGLSMTRSLIHQLNGHIEVRTAPGIGTTVNVVLPVVFADAG